MQKGVLDLDLPIQQYLPKPLPEYEKYADLQGDDRYKKLTLRILLSHTSGFPNFRWFEDDKKLKIHFEPGTRYAYSGEGYPACATRRRDSDRKIADSTHGRRSIRTFGDDSHQHDLGAAVRE